MSRENRVATEEESGNKRKSREVVEMRRGEWDKAGLNRGEGGDESDVQKPTIMVPVQREGGKEGRRERKEKEER